MTPAMPALTPLGSAPDAASTVAPTLTSTIGATSTMKTLLVTSSPIEIASSAQKRPACTPWRRTVCQKPRLHRRICLR